MKRKYKIVCVKWDDAAAEKGPIDEDDFDSHYYVFSSGFEVRNDDTFVSIAQDVIDGHKLVRFRDVMHVPKAMIIKRRILGTIEVKF